MSIKEYLDEKIEWDDNERASYPYSAIHRGLPIYIRVNDFPAEHLYTLIAEGYEMSFNEWPAKWSRPSFSSIGSNVVVARDPIIRGYKVKEGAEDEIRMRLKKKRDEIVKKRSAGRARTGSKTSRRPKAGSRRKPDTQE